MFEDILPIYERPGPFFTNQKCQCNSESVPLNYVRETDNSNKADNSKKKKTYSKAKCKCRVRVHFRFFPIVWKRIRVCCHLHDTHFYSTVTGQPIFDNIVHGWYVPQIYHWRFNRKLVLRVTKYIGHHRCNKACKSPCLYSGGYSSRPVMDERWDGKQQVPIQRSRPKEYTGRYGTIPSNGIVSEFSLWEEAEIDTDPEKPCPCRQREQVNVQSIPRIGSKSPMHSGTEPRKAMRWALRNYLFGIHQVRYRWHWLTQQKRVQDKPLVRWAFGFINLALASFVGSNIGDCG